MTEKRGEIGVLVVTHGKLGNELVEAARVILDREGPLPLHALSIGWDDELGAARELVREAIAAGDSGQGVLLLTDMFGGTPTNLCLSFLQEGAVEIVTGVNLPMVVKSVSLGPEIGRGLGLREVAGAVAEKGRGSVVLASGVMDS